MTKFQTYRFMYNSYKSIDIHIVYSEMFQMALRTTTLLKDLRFIQDNIESKYNIHDQSKLN